MSHEIILITTTIPSGTSDRRISNLIFNFSKYGMPILIHHGNQKKKKEEILYENMLAMLGLFKRTNYEYAIICDNDFFPIDRFMDELSKTLKVIPAGWRTLHFCPGFLWGRDGKIPDEPGKLRPTWPIDALTADPSGRLFVVEDREIYFKKDFWLGGPMAFLVNKATVDNLLDDFKASFLLEPTMNDVILTKILTSNDYICRLPLLGYEAEEGGATFP
jgi:hypothetical protein